MLKSPAVISIVHGVIDVILSCLSNNIPIKAIGNKIPAKLILIAFFIAIHNKKIPIITLIIFQK